jgi:hypothetical protein
MPDKWSRLSPCVAEVLMLISDDLEQCGNSFISFTYSNLNGLSRLLGHLPSSIRPVLYHRQDVAGDEMVSNGIVPTIRACDSLIYIKNHSSKDFGLSLWQKFERDYALRCGKSVFGFDHESMTLTRDASKPVEPFVVSLSCDNDSLCESKTRQLIDYLVYERNCIFLMNNEASEFGQSVEEEASTSKVVVVVFNHQTMSRDLVRRAILTIRRTAIKRSNRICGLIADFDPLGKQCYAQPEIYYLNMTYGTDLIAMSEVVSQLSHNLPLRFDREFLADFLNGITPEESKSLPDGIDINRVDDLIVRLYGLFYSSL